MDTNTHSGTNVAEIGDGIYRINTPIQLADGQPFSFNQYLVVDDEALLFHTGPRKLFPLVSEAIGRVIPLERLRYIGLSHVEADECGSMNEFLASAPQALGDGEQLSLGRHTMRWFDTPHIPHGWECGLMMDVSTSTFFCGDLFTQPGSGDLAVSDGDILGPSETFRKSMDYFAHAPHTAAVLERLAGEKPQTLACMHGSAWRGDGNSLLLELARVVTAVAQ